MMYFSRVRLKSDILRSSNLHRLIQSNSYSVHQLLWDLFPDEKKRTFIFREEIAGEQLGYRPGIKSEPIYYLVSSKKPMGETTLFDVDHKKYSPRLMVGDRLAFKLRANPIVARKSSGEKKSRRHDIVMDAQRNLLLKLANGLGLSSKGSKSTLKQKIIGAWRSSKNEMVEKELIKSLSENERFAHLSEKQWEPDKLLNWALKACADKALEKWLTDRGVINGFRLVRSEKDQRLKFQAEGYRWHSLPTKGKTAGFSAVDFEGCLEVRKPERLLYALSNGIGPAKGFGCGLMLVRRV